MAARDGLYAWQVLRRAWDLVGHFDLLVGLFAAFVATAGWEDVISAKWTDRLLLTSAVLLVVSFGAAVVFGAPWSLWRDERDALAQFMPATSSPPLLELVTPHPLGVRGVLVRLMVENTSPIARTFRARVVKVDGLEELGPEPPWTMPWRHGGADAEHTLPAHDREMLKVANIWADGIQAFVVDPEAEGGLPDPAANTGRLIGEERAFRIRVWDCETGTTVAAASIVVTTSGDQAPIVTLRLPDAAG